jgi:hypothetical protein
MCCIISTDRYFYRNLTLYVQLNRVINIAANGIKCTVHSYVVHALPTLRNRVRLRMFFLYVYFISWLAGRFPNFRMQNNVLFLWQLQFWFFCFISGPTSVSPTYRSEPAVCDSDDDCDPDAREVRLLCCQSVCPFAMYNQLFTYVANRVDVGISSFKNKQFAYHYILNI